MKLSKKIIFIIGLLLNLYFGIKILITNRVAVKGGYLTDTFHVMLGGWLTISISLIGILCLLFMVPTKKKNSEIHDKK